MTDNLLSLVIPTYNRAHFLDRCLALHLPVARELGVRIYVSDNASTDHTREVVASWQADFPDLAYQCNPSNLGADRNFELALKMPVSDYVWLLGDTYHVSRELIAGFIAQAQQPGFAVDAAVFNVDGRVVDVGSRNYDERNELLRELGWHMTCMSALVYSRELIQQANFARFRNSYFLQVGIIFEYIENRDFKVCWCTSVSVMGIVLPDHPKVSWQSQTFHIWVEKWTNFVYSLAPSYSLAAKTECIAKHGKRSDLFTVRGLYRLRSSGLLDYAVLRLYRPFMFPAINVSLAHIFLISSVPVALVRQANRAVVAIRRALKR